MSARHFISVTTAWIVLLAAVPVGCAQDADSLRARADRHLNTGAYDDARRTYLWLLEADPAGAEAVRLADTYLATGDYDAGLETVERLLRSGLQAPYLLQAKGRLLEARGRFDEAERAYVAAIESRSKFWSGGTDLAELLERTGRATEAQRIYATVYRAYDRGDFRTPETLLAAARAAERLGRFRDANEAYRLAHQIDERDIQTLYNWAELFRTKYNDAEARRTYEDVLARNPRHAPSLVGLARSTPSFEQREELAQKAVEVNSNFPEALNLLASLRILDGLYDEAEALARQALDVHPNHIESLAHLGSTFLLRGDSTGYGRIERRALEIDDQPVDFYLAAAENATHRFRYGLAAELTGRAAQVDPENADARAEHGLALMRIGRHAAARRHLEVAFERDPYNLFASNTLTLLDEYENFARLESPHFELWIHQDERDVLGPLMLEVAEASFDSLRSRYPYDPLGKISIEAYNDGDDFAVRIAGVPHRGLLGVSFGDVLAVNTPGARMQDGYNWARTLWHEIAHTMAIGVSENRVPRWFTEGLSVYEESRGRPEWEREMELAFLSAHAKDRLLPLGAIERGFTRPEFPGQVILSYYHAGRVIEFLVGDFGFDAIINALQAFRDGGDSEEALRAATGIGLAELDRRFRDSIEERHRALAEAVDGLPDVLSNEQVELTSVADAAGPLFSQLRTGAARLEQGDLDGASASYESALRLYPNYVGPGNAYEGLAFVYREASDEAALLDILERYIEIAEDIDEPLLELAGLYERRGNRRRSAVLLERSLFVAPYNADVRRRLADIYEELGDIDAAVSHRHAELALQPSDRAGAYFRLGRTLHAGGYGDEAKRAVLQSLEFAPDYRDAQRLLLDIVD